MQITFTPFDEPLSRSSMTPRGFDDIEGEVLLRSGESEIAFEGVYLVETARALMFVAVAASVFGKLPSTPFNIDEQGEACLFISGDREIVRVRDSATAEFKCKTAEYVSAVAGAFASIADFVAAKGGDANQNFDLEDVIRISRGLGWRRRFD